jgi:hypothetical protein
MASNCILARSAELIGDHPAFPELREDPALPVPGLMTRRR